jgi:flagellar basal-body rod protein FlgB
MELNNLAMFAMVKRRLDWFNQRQEVISQNIANADTPMYASRDIAPFNFKKELEKINREQRDNVVSLKLTDRRHIEGGSTGGVTSSGRFRVTQDRAPYETAPDGNQVVLEEQMVRMNENQAAHGMIAQLYKKHLNFFTKISRMGGGGG